MPSCKYNVFLYCLQFTEYNNNYIYNITNNNCKIIIIILFTKHDKHYNHDVCIQCYRW